MKLQRLGPAVLLALVGLVSVGVPAQADHDRDRYDDRDRYGRSDRYSGRYDRSSGYRTRNYPRGYDRPEVSRREILRNRLFSLSDRLRLAVREGDVNPRQADRLYDGLDRICDFLQNDRYLTDVEFSRRQRDLDNLEDDLRSLLRSYGRRRYYR